MNAVCNSLLNSDTTLSISSLFKWLFKALNNAMSKPLSFGLSSTFFVKRWIFEPSVSFDKDKVVPSRKNNCFENIPIIYKKIFYLGEFYQGEQAFVEKLQHCISFLSIALSVQCHILDLPKQWMEFQIYGSNNFYIETNICENNTSNSNSFSDNGFTIIFISVDNCQQRIYVPVRKLNQIVVCVQGRQFYSNKGKVLKNLKMNEN